MDQAVSALFRPRHLLATAFVAILLGGGASGVVGLARAQDPGAVAAEVPPPFVLAVPLEGDRGRYELELNPAGLTEDERRAGFNAARAYDMDFAMGAIEAQYDADGIAHWARRVQLSTYELNGDWNTTESGDVWVVDGRVIASLHGYTTEPDVSADQGALPGQEQTTTSTFAVRQLTFIGSELPCGLFTPLQGRNAPMAGEVLPDTSACAWGPGPLNPNAHWSIVRGLNDTGFLVVDHYETNPIDTPRPGDRPDWTAYYRADIPYPVAIWSSWAQFGGPGDTLRLVGFDRGLGAAAPPATGLPPPLPAVALAERPAWILDDSGVDHPFPLSAAIAYVRADPTHTGLRDYLALHPDAYVHWARHAEFDMEDRHTHRWSFEFTDAGATHQEVVARDETYGPAGLVPGLPRVAPAVSYRYEDGDNAPWGEWRDVPVGQLPEATPTVASLLAIWDAMPAMTANPDAITSWSFQVGCPPHVEGCTVPVLQVGAGQVYYFRTAEPGYPVVDNRLDMWDTSELQWADGQLLGGVETDQVSVRAEEGLVTPPGATPAPETAADALGPAPTPSWLAPTPAQVVGIGFGAILAAAAYWLWPLAKGGGVGLFSRVHKDRLLDNALRAQLVQRIEAEPGIHHNALVRDLGKGKGAAEHHLDKLVAGRLVLRHRGTGYTCYFPVGTDHRDMAAGPATKADGARRILEALRNGATGVRAIAVITDLAPSTVSHHLERLRAAGLVIGDGRTGFQAVSGRGAAGLAAA